MPVCVTRALRAFPFHASPAGSDALAGTAPLRRASTDDKKSPFFLFSYVDDEVAVARGRGGGLAFWARTTPVWEMTAGVDL